MKQLRKYRINENPGYIRAPVVELIPGQEGEIAYVGILQDESMICSQRNGIIDFSECSEMVLAYFDDDMLNCLNENLGLPMEELKETRKLEKEYRKKNS